MNHFGELNNNLKNETIAESKFPLAVDTPPDL